MLSADRPSPLDYPWAAARRKPMQRLSFFATCLLDALTKALPAAGYRVLTADPVSGRIVYLERLHDGLYRLSERHAAEDLRLARRITFRRELGRYVLVDGFDEEMPRPDPRSVRTTERLWRFLTRSRRREALVRKLDAWLVALVGTAATRPTASSPVADTVTSVFAGWG